MWGPFERCLKKNTTVEADEVLDIEGSLRCFTPQQWGSIGDEGQQEVIKRHNVLVVGDRSNSPAGPESITPFESPLLSQLVDLDGQLFVNGTRLSKSVCPDLSHSHRRIDNSVVATRNGSDSIFRGSIRDFLQARDAKRRNCVLNYLDIEATQLPSLALPLGLYLFGFTCFWQLTEPCSALDDSSSLHTRIPELVSWQTLPPAIGLKWILCAHQNTISVPHIDAAGHATCLMVLTGFKLWLIALGRPYHGLGLNSTEGWASDEIRWQIVPLFPNDTL